MYHFHPILEQLYNIFQLLYLQLHSGNNFTWWKSHFYVLAGKFSHLCQLLRLNLEQCSGILSHMHRKVCISALLGTTHSFPHFCQRLPCHAQHLLLNIVLLSLGFILRQFLRVLSQSPSFTASELCLTLVDYVSPCHTELNMFLLLSYESYIFFSSPMSFSLYSFYLSFENISPIPICSFMVFYYCF